MDWACYKRACDSPRVLSRWMIAQTLQLLEADSQADPTQSIALSGALRATLTGRPLDKPADHRGGELTDMFELDLGAADARAVLDAVRIAAACGRTTSATRMRGLGGFVEAWSEYVDFLEHTTTD